MTIDEYLYQLRRLKRREEDLFKTYEELEARAESPRSSFNYNMPRSKNNDNLTEKRLTELIDAGQEWIEARNEYSAFRDQLQDSIYNLLYWEGLLIEQVYINNMIYKRENDLYGADQILKTNNKGAIIRKLRDAKAHLAEILRDQGIEIE